MANILVLVPMRLSLPTALGMRAIDLMRSLKAREEGGKHHVETWFRTCEDRGDGTPYRAHAEARNTMLDLFLKKTHTHVLWIDADVVDYPPDLAVQLLARESAGIIAPTPLIEGSNRFYDVYGFVGLDGQRVERPYPPYPNGPMRSVGTCYLAPASLYHDGARYAPTEGHTEHYSVCKRATRVRVTSDIVIRHADLPAWGERWHTV